MRHALVAVSIGIFLLAKAQGCEHATVRGPDAEQLTLAVPMTLVVHRGGAELLEVGVRRDHFTGPVRITLSNLPRGVVARKTSLTIEAEEADFTLDVSRDADLVANQAVTVTAEGPDKMAVTEYVKLTVRE